MKRTQAEVDGLWPEGDAYDIVGEVAIPNATTVAQAAKVLQMAYDKGMAGSFNVEEMTNRKVVSGASIFIVKFQRDVPDDCDVVNNDLLAGKDFNDALVDQLLAELIYGAGAAGVKGLLKHENPKFYSLV